MTGSAGEDLTRDAFLNGRLTLLQPRKGYRAAIDPLLLAAFAPARAGQRVLDIGCGVGTVALCLAARTPGLELHGLEAQPAYADLARRNAAANGVAFLVHDGDIHRLPPALRALDFELVLMNPPFHPASATPTPDAGRDFALREAEAGLADWIDAGLRRLAPGGTLALIHFAHRLGEILAALAGRAGAVEILPVAPHVGRPALRVLLSARKGSRAPLTLLPPLALHETTGAPGGDAYTETARAILRGGAGLRG